MKLFSWLNGKILRKVPEVAIIFWIIKLLTTAMGETTSDFLVHRFDPILAVLFGGIGFLIAIVIQLCAKKYTPWIYWLAVVMVAIFGTMAADVLHIGFGVPYLVSTIFFAIALAVIFLAWNRFEKTLSIHSIDTHRRELFYWATVITTFALGTAAGDMTAITLHLGYLSSGILFAILIAIPAIGNKWFKMNSIFAFWFAYILTRPLGASFADYLAKPQDLGGLGFGSGTISIILTIFIVGFVAYITATKNPTD